MFLDNIRLYLNDPQTGRLEMRFVCHHCGAEITGEPLWQLRKPRLGALGEFRFWCANDWCYEQDKESK